MKKLKLIFLLIVGVFLLSGCTSEIIGYFKKQTNVVQKNEAKESNQNKDTKFAEDFYSQLPNGDIDSLKCNELYENFRHNTSYYSDINYKTLMDYAERKEDQGFGLPVDHVLDKKYVYSKKMCLALVKDDIYVVKNGNLTVGGSEIYIYDIATNEYLLESLNDHTIALGQSHEGKIDVNVVWGRLKQD